MLDEVRGRRVLVTGGTAGIGLQTGLAFGRAGAHVTLTCRWGSADPSEIERAFAQADAPAPRILEANAASPEDVGAVLDTFGSDGVDCFVSNVAFAQLVRGWSDLQLRGLQQSVEYTAWPLVSHLLAMRERFGRWPKHVVAISSCGPDELHLDYDFAAAAKSVLETLVRYLAHRLEREDCRVNAVRARWVPTASLDATIGAEFAPFVRRYGARGALQTPEEVASVVLTLCSGWLDGMRGQVLTVDHGTRFHDTLMRWYAERDRLLE
ncbi:MAG: SDR family NAD(P)-dependent oxidoreductase [Nannocystaceae bacterium]|nr:SDR family oxidoreductase [bacterium]